MASTQKHPLASCANCPLKGARYFHTDEGFNPDIAIVAEYPTQDEFAAGKAFNGEAYSTLLKTVEIRQNTLTHALGCKPPNPSLFSDSHRELALSCCSNRLKWITRKAKRVVAFGSAIHSYTKKYKIKPSTLRGTEIVIDDQKIYPTYSPNWVTKNYSFAHTWQMDLKNAVEGASNRLNFSEWTIIENAIPNTYDETISIDTETQGLYGELLYVSIGFKVTKTVYILTGDYIKEHKEEFNNLVAGNKVVMHNGKYDIRVLKDIVPILSWQIWDTMLLHYLLHESEKEERHSLKDLGAKYLGVPNWHNESIADVKSIPKAQLYEYIRKDTVATLELYHFLILQFNKELLQAYTTVLQFGVNTLAQIEENGIQVDAKHLQLVGNNIKRNVSAIAQQLKTHACDDYLNPNSPKQLADFIYGSLEGDELDYCLNLEDPELYNSSSKQKNVRSTDDDTLEMLETQDTSGFVKLLRKYRRISKIFNSYIKTLPDMMDTKTNKVHPIFNMHKSETGRLSATKPAIQTIPRAESFNGKIPNNEMYGAQIRSCFVPSANKVFVECDFSQAELRTAAALSYEPFLLDVYERDADLHTEVAIKIFGPNFTSNQRVVAKTINFGWLYGANASVISKQTHIPIEDAHEIVSRYEKSMPVLLAWKKAQMQDAEELGYTRSLFGRYRRFGAITRYNRNDVMKASINAPVQGAASDFTFLSAQAGINNEYDAKIVLLVHDSILLECEPKDATNVGIYIAELMKETAARYLPQVKWKAEWTIKERWCKNPLETNMKEM